MSHEAVLVVLDESGASGDILDIPMGFPVEFEKQAEELGWSVERH